MLLTPLPVSAASKTAVDLKIIDIIEYSKPAYYQYNPEGFREFLIEDTTWWLRDVLEYEVTEERVAYFVYNMLPNMPEKPTDTKLADSSSERESDNL